MILKKHFFFFFFHRNFGYFQGLNDDVEDSRACLVSQDDPDDGPSLIEWFSCIDWIFEEDSILGWAWLDDEHDHGECDLEPCWTQTVRLAHELGIYIGYTGGMKGSSIAGVVRQRDYTHIRFRQDLETHRSASLNGRMTWTGGKDMDDDDDDDGGGGWEYLLAYNPSIHDSGEICLCQDPDGMPAGCVDWVVGWW